MVNHIIISKENYMILTLSTPITTQQLELHLFVGWQSFVYSLKKDTNVSGYLRVDGHFGWQKIDILHMCKQGGVSLK